MSKILFIGAGKMATAIATGIVKSKLFLPCDLVAFDINSAARESFTNSSQVACVDNVIEAVSDAETILIAVKPQYLSSAVSQLKGKLDGKLVLSIVAGVKLEKLSTLLGTNRVIRIMPNTPALVGEGMAAFCGGAGVAKDDFDFARSILEAIGKADQVDEKLMDGVTGLSGSGPAFVFEFIQALADGGVAEGLSRDVALRLAAQTVLGSAKMVLDSNTHPAILKDQVTSPAGTTSRGLELLAERGFSGIVMQAVRSAAKRSSELGKG